jgi:hypothetical protein
MSDAEPSARPIHVPGEPCEACGQAGGEKRLIVATKTAEGWPVYLMWLCDPCFELEKSSKQATAG